MKKRLFVGFCCFLTGCTLFPKGKEPLPLYTLRSIPPRSSYVLKAPLAIDIPMSEPSLDTSRIAITFGPHQRDYLAEGEWPDRLPKVIQEVFLENLSERWGGKHVNRSSVGLQTTYVLLSEIQDFSLYYLETGCPEIRLKLQLRLVDFQNRRVIAAQTFYEQIPLQSYRMTDIVVSFNQALTVLLEKASTWMEGVFSKKK